MWLRCCIVWPRPSCAHKRYAASLVQDHHQVSLVLGLSCQQMGAQVDQMTQRQAMTGCMLEVSVATILAASVSEGQCASDAVLQTWHRLRLAVLHSIWTAASIAASSAQASTPPPASSSSYSHKMALKTVVSMLRHNWVNCNDDVRLGFVQVGSGAKTRV